jgi:hemerythrin superfamily protein
VNDDDVFALLRRDHRALRDLLDQIAEALDDEVPAARAMLDHARREILAHGRGEARSLYVALAAHDETEDLERDALEEHAVIEALIDELVAAPRLGEDVGPRLKAELKILIEVLTAHMTDEEGRIFPRARDILGPDRIDDLAEEFVDHKGEELARLGAEDAAQQLRDGAHVVVRGVD